MSKILTTLQRQLTEQYEAQKFFYSHILFLFLFLQIFYKKVTKKPKIILIVVQSPQKRSYRTLPYKRYKRPPRTKRPPTTDEAGRLTLIRESHPTPPTISDGIIFLPQTSLHTVVSATAD